MTPVFMSFTKYGLLTDHVTPKLNELFRPLERKQFCRSHSTKFFPAVVRPPPPSARTKLSLHVASSSSFPPSLSSSALLSLPPPHDPCPPAPDSVIHNFFRPATEERRSFMHRLAGSNLRPKRHDENKGTQTETSVAPSLSLS